MANNKGKILTIIGNDGRTYLMEGSTWFWTDEMFESKEYTYKDLKKAPIGTKVTFENRELFVKNGEDKFESPYNFLYIDEFKGLTNYKFGKIVKIEEPKYETVYEAKVEILDEVEKRYLKNVIRPFRDKVEAIKKEIICLDEKDEEGIIISLKDGQFIRLPRFKPNTMYKNMNIYKNYTLKELGL